MGYVTKGELAQLAIESQDVELLRGKGVVRIRALSRAEVHRERKDPAERTAEEQERHYLAMCLVNPEMSEDDVAAWQERSTNDVLQDLLEKVMELSGFGNAHAKETYKSV